MNVVGKVGSLISQGVYSVATPFHPFGGAVDIIVVQQQDGTFRSTPWYVRFGKFQGVLKGAEKIVRVAVNGVEANFHMYLDNSGEAYFVREVVSGEGSHANGVLKGSDALEGLDEDSCANGSDIVNCGKENVSLSEQGGPNDEVQLEEEHVSLGVHRLARTESDSDRRFYEFQDDHSSLDGSVDLSEYGSNCYESLDGVEHYVESDNLNSGVVLVSVDGHVLTAPISSSETNADDLQLSIPQFCLGPGQGTEFCEENAGFSTGEGTWATDYFSDLSASAPGVPFENSCSVNESSNAFGHKLEVCEGDREHISEVQGNENIEGGQQESCADGNLKAASVGARKEDIFKSCIELTALAVQDGNANQQDVDSRLETLEIADDSQDMSPCCRPANETEDGDAGKSKDGEGPSPNSSLPAMVAPTDLEVQVECAEEKASTGHKSAENICAQSASNNEDLEEHVNDAPKLEGVHCSPQGSPPDNESNKGGIVEHHPAASGYVINTDSRLQISLCGKLLHAGMGSNAAAEVFDAHRISEEAFKHSAASIIKNENLVIRYQDRYLPWDKAAHIVLGVAAYGLDLPVDPKDAIAVEQDKTPKASDDGSGITDTPTGRRWRLWPIPFRKVKILEHNSSNVSSDEVFLDTESYSPNQHVELSPLSTGGYETPRKQLIRTNVPDTEQIASLNLKEGQNMVTFSFSTRVLGMQKVDAHIYLWKWNARIVISDVDGTITKSDVLGQFMPLVGKDWTQSGVARLFSAIKENGYQLLFLSARAIVQAYLTRSFLLNLKQDGKALPSGPIVISPDGLFPSLYREVIRRAPHEFKIACLEDIKALFPPDYNPFYAGFGNRDTDELSYRKMGIPKGKIFIINPKGEVANCQHRMDVKTYTSLHTLVNDMFPPTSMVEQEDYNSWNYWKMPLPDVEL
ncbi:phosphatidate phosphatase PAH1 [Diospyros lotus]|uniref:phosphatidate phosphatase PAH1 n=1 Tax=Diospyros lotus TaxID=55363 RepID=UPI002257622C|nr:phosphatidate phosphatase PAH1 [Diospyros lotus]